MIHKLGHRQAERTGKAHEKGKGGVSGAGLEAADVRDADTKAGCRFAQRPAALVPKLANPPAESACGGDV
jgi:hypothetical protein